MSYSVTCALPLCSLHICLSLSLFFQMACVQGPWKSRLLGNSETLWQLKSTLHLPSTPRGVNSQRLPFKDTHESTTSQILWLIDLLHVTFLSLIRTWIVSHRDVSNFSIYRGYLWFYCLWIHNAIVFPHHLCKNPQPNFLLFFSQTPRLCGNLIATSLILQEVIYSKFTV